MVRERAASSTLAIAKPNRLNSSPGPVAVPGNLRDLNRLAQSRPRRGSGTKQLDELANRAGPKFDRAAALLHQG